MALTTPVVVVDMSKIPDHSRPSQMAFFDASGSPINFEGLLARVEQLETVIMQIADLKENKAEEVFDIEEPPAKSSRKSKTTN